MYQSKQTQKYIFYQSFTKANTFYTIYCTINDGEIPFSLAPCGEDVMVENCFDNLGYRLLSDLRICVSRDRGCSMTQPPPPKKNTKKLYMYLNAHKNIHYFKEDYLSTGFFLVSLLLKLKATTHYN